VYGVTLKMLEAPRDRDKLLHKRRLPPVRVDKAPGDKARPHRARKGRGRRLRIQTA